jgi:hypothetical protein
MYAWERFSGVGSPIASRIRLRVVELGTNAIKNGTHFKKNGEA